LNWNVRYHFVRPVLHQATVEKILSQESDPMKRRQLETALQGPTWYDLRLAMILKNLELVRYYSSRGSGTAYLDFELSGESLGKDIEELGEKLEFAVEQLQRVGLENRHEITLFQSRSKNAWRIVGAENFLEENLDKLGCARQDMQIAYLPGMHAGEIKMYKRLGIPASNHHVFECKAKRYEEVKVVALNEGISESQVNFEQIETGLPRLDKPMSVVHIDPDGTLKESIFNMFLELPLTERAIVMKNIQASRESGKAREVLYQFAGNRQYIDAIMFKLTGSNLAGRFEAESMLDSMRVFESARELSRHLAVSLAPALEIPSEEAVEFLSELGLRVRHVNEYKVLRYNSPGGSPYASAFMCTNAWSREQLKTDAALHVYQLFSNHVAVYGSDDFSDLDVNVQNDEVVVTVEGQPLSFSLAELRSVYDYWRSQVPQSCSLMEMASKGPLLINI
ncbi:MAG: hypothetical protein KDD62_14970, partial [Bdellovibrionales bacterium]|nr:hypothetical protein [Bdellovibrionales bacterium]